MFTNMKNSFFFKTVVAATLVACGPLAQAESLDSSMQAAVAFNPQIRSAQANRDASEARVTQAQGARLPHLEATGGVGYNRYNAPGIADMSMYRPSNAGISLSLPLYTGGKLKAELAAAESDVRAADSMALDSQQTVMFNAGTAFLKVARTAELLKLAQGQQDLLAKELTQAQAELKAGIRTRTDVAQAESRLAGARAAVQQAQSDADDARTQFRSITGREPQGELLMPEPSGYPSKAEFIQTVLDHNPRLAAAAAQIDVAQEHYKAARAERLPTVSLQAGISRDQDSNPFLMKETNRTIGIQVRIPLYEGGMTMGKEAEKAAQIRQSEADRDDQHESLTADAEAAFNDYESTQAQLTALDQQVTAAATALDGARKELRVGTRTLLDVLNAEQELLDARVSHVNAVFQQTGDGLRMRALAGALSS
jgi:outer membrane protein